MPYENEYLIRTNPPRVMSLKEAVIYTDMSTSSLRRAVATKGLPSIRGTYRLTFRLVDIDRWLETQIQGA